MAALSTLIAALERLARSEPLDDLLRDTHIGSAGGVALSEGCRGTAPAALQHLDLYGCGLGDEGAVAILAMLAEQPGCTRLDLGANSLSQAATAAIAPLVQPDAASLSRNVDERRTGLTELRLARNAIGSKALTSMLSPISSSEGLLSLHVLALAFNPLGEGGGVHLGRVLAEGRLPFLTTLQLQGCELKAEGATAIAGGLKAARRLLHLDLSDNMLGDGGGTQLAIALPSTRSLEELLLTRNQLGDPTGHALATSLGKWGKRSTLKLLGLASNGLRDASACELASALGAPRAQGGNRSIERVDLAANKLSHASLLAFGDAAVANDGLVRVDLRRNRHIDDEGLRALEALTNHNESVRSGLTPPPLVLPDEATKYCTSRKVRSLFTGGHEAGGQRMPSIALGHEAVSALAASNVAEAAREATLWSARERALINDSLKEKQTAIEEKAREISRLRAKEAALIEVLEHQQENDHNANVGRAGAEQLRGSGLRHWL